MGNVLETGLPKAVLSVNCRSKLPHMIAQSWGQFSGNLSVHTFKKDIALERRLREVELPEFRNLVEQRVDALAL